MSKKKMWGGYGVRRRQHNGNRGEKKKKGRREGKEEGQQVKSLKGV